MYFFILILCLNTIASMINTNPFFDFTDFQVLGHWRPSDDNGRFVGPIDLRHCESPGIGSPHRRAGAARRGT